MQAKLTAAEQKITLHEANIAKEASTAHALRDEATQKDGEIAKLKASLNDAETKLAQTGAELAELKGINLHAKYN